MARDRKTRRSDPQAIGEPSSFHQGFDKSSVHTHQFEISESPRSWERDDSPDVPPEIAQEIWEQLKEEFFEPCQTELLPTIRSYIKVRQTIQEQALRSRPDPHSQDLPRTTSVSSSIGSDPDSQTTRRVMLGGTTQRLSNTATPANLALSQSQEPTQKEEEFDTSMEDVVSQPPLHSDLAIETHVSHNLQSSAESTTRDSLSSHTCGKPSQSAARTQGIRETDATVPKSVPFPPRPKPKTTRELLTRISFLTGELLRASEEKVGLATAAYDSVDRHVRALDAAIKEHENAAALGLREGTYSIGRIMQEMADPATHGGEGDDEEPQLGMIGPAAGDEGQTLPRLSRNSKKDTQIHRKLFVDGQLPIRLHLPSGTTHHEMPIDPHEPRYCYCNQVSYGEMIACDNPNCGGEWFHLGCAGLAAPPKGKVKWYCRDCEDALGRNRRRRLR
ncbi:hypothetical protein K439DRAFT_1661980 [Ramaria rubella]|nr:hypothetical protein K439DRAFT_1661980 [Ramaria rubella]